MPTVTLTKSPSATTEGVWYFDSFAGAIYPCSQLWSQDGIYFSVVTDVDNDGVFTISGRNYDFPNFQALGVVTITDFSVTLEGVYGDAPLVGSKLGITAYPSVNSASGSFSSPIISTEALGSLTLSATAADITASASISPAESAQIINARAGAQQLDFGVTIACDGEIAGTIFIDSFTYTSTYEQGNSQQRQFLKAISTILTNS